MMLGTGGREKGNCSPCGSQRVVRQGGSIARYSPYFCQLDPTPTFRIPQLNHYTLSAPRDVFMRPESPLSTPSGAPLCCYLEHPDMHFTNPQGISPASQAGSED